MKIVFAGGGTLGPVMPLLAVLRALKKMEPRATFAWIGTPNGPEKTLLEEEGVSFFSLPVVKWPRYLSVRWLTFPFAWARARREAVRFITKLKPAAIVTAGGFTAVPVVYAAAKRKIPCFTHQLDLIPGLANKKIAHFCRSVTTSFEYEKGPFGYEVTDIRIPTPVALACQRIPSREVAVKHFGLDPKKPVVFLFGGGTGAQALNQVIERGLHQWMQTLQLIHVTGVGKEGGLTKKKVKGYVSFDLITKDIVFAYAAADVVICRGGMGTLSEISYLSKAAIVVPIPHSHQEANVHAFEEQGACVVVDQTAPKFEEELLTNATLLVKDAEARKRMGERAHAFLPTDDGAELMKRVLKGLNS